MMVPKDAVVIIDANGAIKAGGINVLTRHAKYGEILQRDSNGELHLVIVGSKKLCTLVSENSIRDITIVDWGDKIITQLRSIFTVKKQFQELEIKPKLFVLGDPWKCGITGIFLRTIFFRNIPFQLQIHADLAAPGWKSQSAKYFLKYIIARISMAKFKYLRFVSKRQANNFRFRQTKHIDVIPVALSKVEFGQTPRKVNGEFVLGFLGRLHKDRGTETLIKIFQNLLPNHPEVRLIIAGDGPEEKRISSELVDRYPMQVTLLGQVSERIKEVFWTEIDVLISLAPFESYGLAIRESVLYSRPVLAFPTSGTIDLLDSVGKSWVALIGRLDSDTDILIKAQNIASLQNRSDLPKVFTEPPDAVKLIVGSWTKIIG